MLKKIKWALTKPDEYAILQTAPDRRVVERLDEPITALEAQERFGLQDGRFVCQEVRAGRYTRCLWSEEIGDPREARELDELKHELAGIRAEIETGGDLLEQVPAATMQAVLGGQLSVQEARAVADLHAAFAGRDRGRGLSESVKDPTDISEVGGRALLAALDDPTKLEAAVEAAGRAAGGFAVGAIDASAEDRAEPRPDREREEDPEDDDREPARGRTPSAKQRFEELEGDVAGALDAVDVDGAVDGAPEPAVADGGEIEEGEAR